MKISPFVTYRIIDIERRDASYAEKVREIRTEAGHRGFDPKRVVFTIHAHGSIHMVMGTALFAPGIVEIANQSEKEMTS